MLNIKNKQELIKKLVESVAGVGAQAPRGPTEIAKVKNSFITTSEAV